MKRQEARIRAERLGTSQHGKEETRLTRIRDINERTATRAGDLGQVEGGVHVVMGERTQKDTQGWDHGEGDSGGMGGGRTGDHCRGETWARSWGGKVSWWKGALGNWGGRGWILKEGDAPGRGKPKKASPVPSSFTMPSPSALFCLSKALRSRTLRERKERW